MSDEKKKRVRVRPRRAGAARAGAVKARKGNRQPAKKKPGKAGAVKARQGARQDAGRKREKAAPAQAAASRPAERGRGAEKVVRLAGERVSEQTSLALKAVSTTPEAAKLREAVEVIKADPVMSIEAKQRVFRRFLVQYATLFDLDNCPDDYQSLKLEAKFLAGMSGHTFVVLAQRLKKIRERKLYKEDGYPSFTAFIDGELSMMRTTVYNYMNILTAFGEKALLAGENVEYTKLLPAVSILNAKEPAIPKDRIRKEFLEAAKVKTHREISLKAKELKTRYGLPGGDKRQDGDRLVRLIDWFRTKLPGRLTEKERQELVALIAELQELVSLPTA